MHNAILIKHAKFPIGQPVRHTLLQYRGIVVDVDLKFQLQGKGSEHIMKDEVAREQIWYQVLVHNTDQLTYVPETHLLIDSSQEDIDHPVLELLFRRDEAGHYQRRNFVQ
jgi:heat shock protein HspQ